MSATHRASALVALAALWGAVDVVYSIYLLASEPAGVLRTMAYWLPDARQAVVVSAVLGVFIGGALFVGAFMTHQGARTGLLVLLAGILLYTISGLGYAAWGLVVHDERAADIFLANQNEGNEINNAIWAYFVGVGCTSLLVGVAFLIAIRRAWRRFSETPSRDSDASPHGSTTEAGVSLASEIERLEGLRGSGLLSDDEYRQAKTRLLS